MNSLEKLSSLILLTTALILSSACSLEDGSNAATDTPADTSAFDLTNSVAAVIDTTNSQDLANAGTESIVQAVKNKQAAFFTGAQAAKVGNESPVQFLTVAMTQQMAQNPSLAIIEDPETGTNICDSGQIDLSIQTKTITATNCTKDGTTINGTATVSNTESGTLKIATYVFTDFTITTATDSATLNFAVICETDTTTSNISCSYKSLSTGIDNRQYISSVIAISGDNNSGYNATTTVKDPVHGTVNVVATNVTVNCTNGQPGTGAIKITDESSHSLDVTFDSCSSYTVTFNGVATPFTW